MFLEVRMLSRQYIWVGVVEIVIPNKKLIC